MGKKGLHTLAYLDDYAGAESSKEKATKAYSTFQDLASSLGLELALNKCAEPATTITWLGFNLDSIKMEVSIPDQKLKDVLWECDSWMERSKASKSMIQSLLGKLMHLANCVTAARKLTGCITSTLSYMHQSKQSWTTISAEFKEDVNWFRNFTTASNGKALIAPKREEIDITCDSSMTGGGGHSNSHYYSWVYSEKHRLQFPAIHQLEATNLVVAYRTLCPKSGTAGKNIVLITDNLSSAYALSTGCTRDSVLSACAREMWLQAAVADHDILFRHMPGVDIPLADALSRQHDDSSKKAYAVPLKITNSRCVTLIFMVLNSYNCITKSVSFQMILRPYTSRP